MSTGTLPPDQGFLSPGFLSSFLTMVCTVILNQLGIPPEFLQKLPGGASWLPIAIVGVIICGLVISTYWRTRPKYVERTFPVNSKIAIPSYKFLQTPEFLLSTTVVVIKVLQEAQIAGESISNSTTTTFFILAIVYVLSRSQLKQAYMKSLLRKVMEQGNVHFTPEGVMPRLPK